MGRLLLGMLVRAARGTRLARSKGQRRDSLRHGRHRSPYGEMPIVGCERKIAEANKQADIERNMNGLSQAYYRLASFFITGRGASRGEAAYRRVMERRFG